MRNRKSVSRGFLLVELLLALAVLGVGLFAVFRSFSTTMAAHQAAKDVFEASLPLEARLWAWRKTGVELPTDNNTPWSSDDQVTELQAT